MKILIDIGHPAHVHLFKNFAWKMQDRGHDFMFTCREKEFEVELLKAYGFKYISFGKKYKSLPGKIFGLLIFNLRIFLVALKFKPDIFISAGSIYAAQVSGLMRKPHITFEDTGNMEQIRLYMPFTDVVFSPFEIPENLGKKQFRYHAYHELAYLHPKYFEPSDDIYEFLGIPKGQKYAILRFVSWDATHDVGQNGFSAEEKNDLVDYLSKNYKLFISSENKVPTRYEKFVIKIPPEKIHDALGFAELVVSEGATMASEAGVLGTPSIYVNSLIRCYNEDQEKYGLVFNFQSGKGVLEKAEEIRNGDNNIEVYKNRQEIMLKEKIDITALLIWFVEGFPETKKELLGKPNLQFNFN